MIEYELRDLIIIRNGKQYPDLAETGKTPVYGSGGLMGYTSSNGLYYGESILLPRKGTLSNLMYVDGNFWTVDTMYYATINEKADPYYLWGYLSLLNLSNLNSGSAVPSMTFDSYYGIKVQLPDIKTQKRVASLLRIINKAIELNNKANDRLEKIAKSLYDYWFVQFDFPDEKNRPYKTNGGEMVWSEELKREIPKGWEVKKVSDFVDVVTGKEDANFATDDGKYAYFTCGKDVLKCNKPAFNGKSVLIAGNGSFDVKYYDGEFNAYQRTYVLRPKDDKYVGIIYKNAFDSTTRFAQGSNGSIVKFITKGDVENIKLLVPDGDKLLKLFNSTLQFIEANNRENQRLSNLRDFLLPMLMNGQVTVS